MLLFLVSFLSNPTQNNLTSLGFPGLATLHKSVPRIFCLETLLLGHIHFLSLVYSRIRIFSSWRTWRSFLYTRGFRKYHRDRCLWMCEFRCMHSDQYSLDWNCVSCLWKELILTGLGSLIKVSTEKIDHWSNSMIMLMEHGMSKAIKVTSWIIWIIHQLLLSPSITKITIQLVTGTTIWLQKTLALF